MKNLINKIINNLSDDLLKSKYRHIENKNKFTGHCYVATEALYYLMSEEDRIIFKPAILKVNNDTHWFLKNKLTGEIIDITKNQFEFELDYVKSKNKFFLTNKPSKRAQILINRINEKASL